MSDTVLPESWIETNLSEICLLNPKVKLEDDLDVGFMPMTDMPTNYFGNTSYEIRKWEKVKKGYTQFKNDDTLFAKITPCFENSKAAIISGFPNSWGAGSTEYYVLRSFGQLVDNRLLFALVKTKDFLVNGAANMSGSVGHRRVPKDFVENYTFPLMPIAEQKQIANKLDELLAQVDIIKTRLDAIPNILKRFRQSVLAAAVSGKLTEEWRGDNEYLETDLGFKIPTSWSLQSIEDIAHVKGGKRLPKGEELVDVDTGYRYIRAGQLKNGIVINGRNARNKQKYISSDVHEKIKRYTISEGDAYITIVGASIGDAGLIPAEFDGANLTENAAKICEFKKPVCNAYIGYWLRSQYIQDLIQLEIKSGAQGKLALMRIKTLPFPEVSLEEQTEIVRRVEKLFTLADQSEQQVNNAQGRVNHLTQSILAKAFRGDLTAEWREQNSDLISGENSAEALLVKIKSEKETLKPTKKVKRKKIA